ncbi:uncharacterized protein PSFLO_01953 [Pseudozyma flocculosa]|uniref:Uncharacterized protein n=1 Tax=Pseudozyma flocculosa TaxID=84751 RepID=A0A5C3EWP0_9BASI|nr:uncharacterized protein PSFLO_01953 [Pseudozyma flocculosa]
MAPKPESATLHGSPASVDDTMGAAHARIEIPKPARGRGMRKARPTRAGGSLAKQGGLRLQAREEEGRVPLAAIPDDARRRLDRYGLPVCLSNRRPGPGRSCPLPLDDDGDDDGDDPESFMVGTSRGTVGACRHVDGDPPPPPHKKEAGVRVLASSACEDRTGRSAFSIVSRRRLETLPRKAAVRICDTNTADPGAAEVKRGAAQREYDAHRSVPMPPLCGCPERAPWSSKGAGA